MIDSRACTVRDSISQQEIRASRSALCFGRVARLDSVVETVE